MRLIVYFFDRLNRRLIVERMKIELNNLSILTITIE